MWSVKITRSNDERGEGGPGSPVEMRMLRVTDGGKPDARTCSFLHPDPGHFFKHFLTTVSLVTMTFWWFEIELFCVSDPGVLAELSALWVLLAVVFFSHLITDMLFSPTRWPVLAMRIPRVPHCLGPKVYPEVPEGGWGWVVAVAFFLVEVNTYGVVKSLGIFLQDLMEEFQESNSRVSWVISISVFIFAFTGQSPSPVLFPFLFHWKYFLWTN